MAPEGNWSAGETERNPRLPASAHSRHTHTVVVVVVGKGRYRVNIDVVEEIYLEIKINARGKWGKEGRRRLPCC